MVPEVASKNQLLWGLFEVASSAGIGALDNSTKTFAALNNTTKKNDTYKWLL